MSRCAYPFAPGAIEHHRSRQRAELARWARLAVRAAAWSAGIALLAGIATGARAAGADDAAQAERPALLPTTVGLHLVSHHTRTGCEQAPAGQCLGWNNRNPGVYARWANGLTVGVLRNSLYRTGVYAGWTGERSVATVVGMPVSAAMTAGITTGYDRVVQDDFAGQPGKGQHTAVRCDAAGRCRTDMGLCLGDPDCPDHACTRHPGARSASAEARARAEDPQRDVSEERVIRWLVVGYFFALAAIVAAVVQATRA